MTKNIKEILGRLDFNEWEVDLYKVPITWCEMYDIRDYITNLQEENKKLKETNEEHRKINGDLRKENQKLVKVINELEKWLKEQDDEHQPYYGTYDYNGEYEDVLDKLTELKGGSDEK